MGVLLRQSDTHLEQKAFLLKMECERWISWLYHGKLGVKKIKANDKNEENLWIWRVLSLQWKLVKELTLIKKGSLLE